MLKSDKQIREKYYKFKINKRSYENRECVLKYDR